MRGSWWRPLLPWLAAALIAMPAAGQTQPPAETRPRPTPVAGKIADAAASDWNSLSNAQKEALRPLSASWNSLTPAQKRKWLALSRNFAALPEAEQATLHSRMTAWAALSAKERTEARLNFAETRRLPAQEKKAKWEEYQALSPEEKHKLAARTPRHASTALAVKPIPSQKLILPLPPQVAQRPNEPGTAVAPQQLQPHTLLPRSPARTAPVPPRNP